MRWFLRCPAAALAVHALIATPAVAQAFRGAVRDAETDAPVVAAELTLLDSLGTTAVASSVSDSAGLFNISAPAPGTYRLRAERVGYARVESPPIEIANGEMVDVSVTLDVEAVVLDPIVVTERSDYAAHAREYFRRLERRRASLGAFITREDIEKRRLPNLSNYLVGVNRVHLVYNRMSQGHVVMGSGSSACVPAIYIDGLVASDARYSIPIDNLIVPSDVEGIEVYRTASQAPPRYWDQSGCGSILIWTRRAGPDDGPFSWTKTLIGVGLFGVLLLLNLR